MKKAIATRELADWLDGLLQPARFKDYCPNGLQIEGRERISTIIAGVTASEALLRAAIERGADAVLVHHGWFWKNEDPRVRGPRRTRLALVLAHDLNLFAYHLPLDAHPLLGNNAQLARVLGLEPDATEDGRPLTCGTDGLVWLGTAPDVDTL
jgi:putative NIF3 family GTP cyclohydrolase 1 type 2